MCARGNGVFFLSIARTKASWLGLLFNSGSPGMPHVPTPTYDISNRGL